MNFNNYNNFNQSNQKGKSGEWRCPLSVVLALLCVTIVATVLLTFTLTSQWVRVRDGAVIEEQQKTIDSLKETLAGGNSGGNDADSNFAKLDVLASLFERYSYYSKDFDTEKMIDDVLRAYAKATGDKYAAYYTEEEYAKLLSDNQGSGVGIGVKITQDILNVGGQDFLTFNIISIFQNSPAASTDLRIGDQIYAIQIDGEFKTIEELGGFDLALNIMRGEVGSTAVLRAIRANGNGTYDIVEVEVVRNTYVQEVVSYRVSETDSKVGIVRLDEFNMVTPVQFKEAVQALQAKGVEYFVFDVRNNPGGDLKSITAVLSYLLNDGDLILNAVDNKDAVAGTIYAGAASYTGSYAPCSVAQDEVGMFANLKMVVLCNENTASAAEVFVASLRDHKNITIVGQKTFGKGIIQTYYNLAGVAPYIYTGYVKMTVYAYVTACGVTYHGIGISPTEGYEVELSDEAWEYNFYVLPENIDNQLLKAIEAVKNQ